MALNLVDGLQVLIALLSVWGGTRRGFFFATLQLLTLAMSIVLAFVAYPFMTAWLRQHVAGGRRNTLPLGVAQMETRARCEFVVIVGAMLR